MKYFIGVDPGKSGAIVLISEDKADIVWFPMPLVGDQIDESKLCILLKDLNECGVVHCCVEDVHSIFGVSAKANWSFAYGAGLLSGIITALHIPLTKVQPKVWQKELFQGTPIIKKEKGLDTKPMALFTVQRLFPEVNLLRSSRCKKPDEGAIDALLIAEYCRRNFK